MKKDPTFFVLANTLYRRVCNYDVGKVIKSLTFVMVFGFLGIRFWWLDHSSRIYRNHQQGKSHLTDLDKVSPSYSCFKENLLNARSDIRRSKTFDFISFQMVGIRTPSESGYALFTDNPVNLVEHCLQASVKVSIVIDDRDILRCTYWQSDLAVHKKMCVRVVTGYLWSLQLLSVRATSKFEQFWNRLGPLD